MQRLALPTGMMTGVALGCVFIAGHDPTDPSSVLTRCPTKMLLGLDCPVCGAVRMIHALLHGDIVAAVHDNIVLFALLPVLLVGAITWLRTVWTGGHWVAPVWLPSPLLLPVVAIGWMVVRNIPAFPLHPLG